MQSSQMMQFSRRKNIYQCKCNVCGFGITSSRRIVIVEVKRVCWILIFSKSIDPVAWMELALIRLIVLIYLVSKKLTNLPHCILISFFLMKFWPIVLYVIRYDELATKYKVEYIAGGNHWFNSVYSVCQVCSFINSVLFGQEPHRIQLGSLRYDFLE